MREISIICLVLRYFFKLQDKQPFRISFPGDIQLLNLNNGKVFIVIWSLQYAVLGKWIDNRAWKWKLMLRELDLLVVWIHWALQVGKNDFLVRTFAQNLRSLSNYCWDYFTWSKWFCELYQIVCDWGVWYVHEQGAHNGNKLLRAFILIILQNTLW